MPSRIVVFGATGYTGRLTAEQLVAQGARPLLAGRSELRLAELAERLGGLEHRVADVDRPESVAALVEPGDVLLSTVGPFKRWGEPAVRGRDRRRRRLHRLDRRAGVHPARVRRPRRARAARRRGAAARAGLRLRARARSRARSRSRRPATAAVRVDVGYYALGGGAASLSRGTQGVAGRRRARSRVRLPRRPDRHRPLRRARALVRGPRQGPPGDLGRRRGALRAPGRLSAAARGQRLPRLVRAGLARDPGVVGGRRAC